jgi:uncharacterized protein HemX
MTKYLIIALAALALALGGTGWALKRQIGANAVQKTLIDQLQATAKANKALIQKRARENAAAKAQIAAQAAELDRSLFKNREWAEQPIPQEVQYALE